MDPGPYYYSGGGQFYSPQMVCSLSETSQTGTQGSGGGPAGTAVARPQGEQKELCEGLDKPGRHWAVEVHWGA